MFTKHLAKEWQHEMQLTRKMLDRYAAEHFSWKPHEKSQTFGQLSSHIAQIVDWAEDTMQKPLIDFAVSKPALFKSSPEGFTKEQLLEAFDKSFEGSIKVMENLKEDTFGEKWMLKYGDQIFGEMPRIAAYKGLVLNHIIHHRGQMSGYLRQLDIPVPGIYGPSADEQM